MRFIGKILLVKVITITNCATKCLARIYSDEHAFCVVCHLFLFNLVFLNFFTISMLAEWFDGNFLYLSLAIHVCSNYEIFSHEFPHAEVS